MPLLRYHRSPGSQPRQVEFLALCSGFRWVASTSGKPLGWAPAFGKSRVVYLQLGHGPESFDDANYRTLLRQNIRWTARR